MICAQRCRGWRAVLPLVAFGACTRSASSPPRAAAELPAVAERWLLTFRIMGGLFRTPVELSRRPGGPLRATALGPPLVRFTDARLAGRLLRLKGHSRFGTVHVAAQLVGDSLAGRWRIKVLEGSVAGRRDHRVLSDTAARLAAFDTAWAAVARTFYDPTFAGVDWNAARRRYRPLAAQTTTDGELLDVVRRMFGELRSSHLDFSAISLADAFPTRGGGRAASEASQIHWRYLAPRLAYLHIAQFDEGQAALRSVDAAFAALRATTGLVIDVRGNPGGTLGAAMRVGDHLLESPRPVGYFATRAGLAARGARHIDDLDPSRLPVYAGYRVDDFQRVLGREGAVMITTGGRIPSPYRGRVVLLVDERSGSTTEAFAAVLKELGRATLVGRTTAGAMLSATEVPIVGGWVVRVPEADFRTPRGKRVEGLGVEPDVPVRHRRFRDAELGRAVEVIRAGQ
jgi:hypothetical protein